MENNYSERNTYFYVVLSKLSKTEIKHYKKTQIVCVWWMLVNSGANGWLSWRCINMDLIKWKPYCSRGCDWPNNSCVFLLVHWPISGLWNTEHVLFFSQWPVGRSSPWEAAFRTWTETTSFCSRFSCLNFTPCHSTSPQSKWPHRLNIAEKQVDQVWGNEATGEKESWQYRCPLGCPWE